MWLDKWLFRNFQRSRINTFFVIFWRKFNFLLNRNITLYFFIFLFNFPLLSLKAGALDSIFGIDRPKTRHIIAVDVSLSMVPYFQNVISAFTLISQSLPNSDSVSIYKFGNRPSKICTKIAGKINNEDFPMQPTDQKTDIWAMLQEIIFDIESNPADLYVIFFLTDGIHDPPPWSNINSYDIVQRANSILTKTTVVAYGIGIGQNTDIALLQRVWGAENVRLFTCSPRNLNQEILKIIDDIKNQWLKAAVRKELEIGGIVLKQIFSRERKDKILLRYSLTSNYPHLPVSLYLNDIKSKNLNIEIYSPKHETLIIYPRKSQNFDIFIKKPSINKWLLGRRYFYLQDEGRLEAYFAFKHEREIRRLNITPTVNVHNLSININQKIKAGIPVSFLLGCLCSFIFLIFYGKKWLCLPFPYVYGTISYPDLNLTRKLDICNKEKITIGGGENDNIKFLDLPPQSFEIKVRREKGWDILVLSPFEGKKITLDGEMLVEEKELKRAVHTVEVKYNGYNKILNLNNVEPRKVPSRDFVKFVFLVLVLVIFNFGLWKFGL